MKKFRMASMYCIFWGLYSRTNRLPRQICLYIKWPAIRVKGIGWERRENNTKIYIFADMLPCLTIFFNFYFVTFLTIQRLHVCSSTGWTTYAWGILSWGNVNVFMIFLWSVLLKTDSKRNVLLTLAMLSKFSVRGFLAEGKVVQTVWNAV